MASETLKKNQFAKGRNGKQVLIYIILFLLALPIMLMYTWLLLSSFSEQMKYGILPQGFTLENWKFLWGEATYSNKPLPSIWLATWNSFIFAGVLTILEVIIGVMAGYAISRLNFPGRKLLMKSTLLLHAFPSVALLIGVFYILNFFGLFDSLLGVILVKTAMQIPMTAWIIKGFFDEVPWDIEYAGLVDGYTRFQVWYKIIIPQVKPGIAAVAIFSFLSGWSEFLLLYTFIISQDNITLAAYLQILMSNPNMTGYGLLSAVSIFYMIPVIIFFIFTQKSLMQVSAGGGKGA